MTTIVIPVFPGTNCEVETQRWISDNLIVDTHLAHHLQHIKTADAIVIPGGFSYGDYLRTGALAARSKCMQSVIAFAQQNVPVLGICNGFQILCEAKLLPGCLVQNITGRHHHEIMSVSFATNAVCSPWLPAKHKATLHMPISCGFGLYLPGPVDCKNSVLLRYNSDQLGSNVAAVCKGNVLGMMPHPERASDALLGGTDGLLFLLGLSESLNLQTRKKSQLETFKIETANDAQ